MINFILLHFIQFYSININTHVHVLTSTQELIGVTCINKVLYCKHLGHTSLSENLALKRDILVARMLCIILCWNIVILMSCLIWKGNSYTFWTVSEVKPCFKIFSFCSRWYEGIFQRQVIHIFFRNVFFFSCLTEII